MRATLLLLAVMTFLTVGCNSTSPKTESPQNGKIIQDQDLVSQINSSQNTVTINDVEYMMNSYAWRDFMPIVNPPVRLNVNNTLIRKDGNTIESDVEIVQQYVVQDKIIWVPDDIEIRQNQSSPNELNIISWEGPTWGIGSKVNIGLKIKNTETGETFWLSVLDVTIAETQ